MSDHASQASEHMTDTFIVVQGERTLRMALIELEAQGGQEWWFLVVQTGEPGKLLAAPFQVFRTLLEGDETLLEKPLVDMGFPLFPADWVRPEADLRIAYDKSANNRYGLVFIAEESNLPGSGVNASLEVLGVIHAGTRQAIATPDGGSLFDLLARAVLPGAPPVPKTEQVSDALLKQFDSKLDLPGNDLDGGNEPGDKLLTDLSEMHEVIIVKDELKSPKMEPSRKESKPPDAEPQESMTSKGAIGGTSDPFVEAELEELMLEEAPQPRSTGAASDEGEVVEAAEEINVSVAGDVASGGTINVAGRDVIYNVLPPNRQTKDQDRRFEVAFPHEVQRDETYDLWVVVALPDAPPFFADEQEANIIEEKPEAAVSVEFEVDRATGKLKPAEIEVQVTGDGFEIVGASSRLLTVYPDGTPDKRRFLVKALETGKQRLIVEFMQDGKLLKEMTIVAEVFAPEKKPVGGVNLSFQVAIFGARLSFATGGGA